MAVGRDSWHDSWPQPRRNLAHHDSPPQAARAKLEVERAAEGLVRAVACCKGVADLPRLEAAVLAARKLGAQCLHPEAYR